MDSGGPPPISSSRRSFYQKAALAGVLATPIALGFSILACLMTSGGDAPHREAGLRVVGMISLFIMGIGLVSAIIALCGIPKHGKKGLFVRGWIGIGLPIILVFLVIPSVLAASKVLKKINDPDFQLKAIAAEVEKASPKMIDKYTRLDGAEVPSSHRIVYLYTIVSLTKDQIPADALATKVRPNVVDAYRTNPGLKGLREMKATMVYRYRDKNGEPIGDIVVDENDLKEQ